MSIQKKSDGKVHRFWGGREDGREKVWSARDKAPGVGYPFNECGTKVTLDAREKKKKKK